MIKVIATDLDGTLFYPKRKRNMIPSKNIEFLKQFKEAGGKIVLVSGRSHFYAAKVIERLGFVVDSICCNGAVVHYDEVLKEEHFLPLNFGDILKELEEKFDFNGQALMSKNIQLAIRGRSDNTCKTKLNNAIFSIFYSLQGVYKEKYVSDPKVFDEELKKGEIYKFLLYFGTNKKAQKAAEEATNYINKTYDAIEAAYSGGSVEITDRNISKAAGLNRYCEAFGISKDEVIVCGDSGNDVAMFETFNEHSFVMSHAPKGVKKFARYELDRVSDLKDYIEKLESEKKE